MASVSTPYWSIAVFSDFVLRYCGIRRIFLRYWVFRPGVQRGGGGGRWCSKNKIWSQIPYPIYDQNLRFSLPYLLPAQNFDTLFMTVAADTVALNTIFEGLLFMALSIMRKKQLPLKHNQFKTRAQKSIPSLRPKWLKNHTLWGRTYPYSPYKGVRSPLVFRTPNIPPQCPSILFTQILS